MIGVAGGHGGLGEWPVVCQEPPEADHPLVALRTEPAVGNDEPPEVARGEAERSGALVDRPDP